MKILIIIISNTMDLNFVENISILNEYMKGMSETVEYEYAGISSSNDFSNYENIINFKYKIINPKKQFSKMCDFITTYKEELNYDWFIKIRPNVQLLEPINFNNLLNNSINARARLYYGPKKIMYGMSVGGDGIWEMHKDCQLHETENSVILDDHIYIFDKFTINNNAFCKIIPNTDSVEHEWFHTRCWTERNINLNVIGINMVFMYSNFYKGLSGNINI